MSRVEKYSRNKRKQQQETALQVIHDEEGETLPSRSKKHLSTKTKLTRLYYNLLFVFFVALVVALFIYGYQYTLKS